MGRVMTDLLATGPAYREASLVDLLDRVLATGVVLSGDVTISLAGIDLITVRLHALITSVRDGGTDHG
jgi:gas vesicle protein GvpA/GvpJ/GvpM family